VGRSPIRDICAASFDQLKVTRLYRAVTVCKTVASQVRNRAGLAPRCKLQVSGGAE